MLSSQKLFRLKLDPFGSQGLPASGAWFQLLEQPLQYKAVQLAPPGLDEQPVADDEFAIDRHWVILAKMQAPRKQFAALLEGIFAVGLPASVQIVLGKA